MLADPGLTGVLGGTLTARLKAALEAITRMMAYGWDRLKEEVLNKDVPKRYDNQLGEGEGVEALLGAT